jgi:hypothetical protein
MHCLAVAANSFREWRIVAAFAVAVAPLLVSPAVDATLIGTNIIVNGDAESDIGAPNAVAIVSPSAGWTLVGDFTVVQYGALGGFPNATSPGPSSRGLNFFAGGPNNIFSSAEQTVDVSTDAALIDSGLIEFTLEAFLGGFSFQADRGTLTATFLNSVGSTLGTSSVGPVTTGDRGSISGLLATSANGAVPVGTREIDISLQMMRFDGSYNDGYADNLSLVLTSSSSSSNSAAEPSVLALFGLGLLGLGYVKLRRTSN